MSNDPHKTRDRRFAYISRGDITRWAKGTTHATYPEPKRVVSRPLAITSLDACVMHSTAKPAPIQATCMIGLVDNKKTVAQTDVESDDLSDGYLDIPNRFERLINRRLA